MRMLSVGAETLGQLYKSAQGGRWDGTTDMTEVEARQQLASWLDKSFDLLHVACARKREAYVLKRKHDVPTGFWAYMCVVLIE